MDFVLAFGAKSLIKFLIFLEAAYMKFSEKLLIIAICMNAQPTFSKTNVVYKKPKYPGFDDIILKPSTYNCYIGSIEGFDINFIYNDTENKQEKSLVIQTGKDTRTRNAYIQYICTSLDALTVKGRLKDAFDNILAASNLCLSKSITAYKSKDIEIGEWFFYKSNNFLGRAKSIIIISGQYYRDKKLLSGITEYASSILPMSKTFPKLTTEAVAELSAGELRQPNLHKKKRMIMSKIC